MSDGHQLNPAGFLLIFFKKLCLCVCWGEDLCACVGGGRGGYQVFFITLPRIPLSQGLSPNLDPGCHPSVSKGPPVLSHYHGVGKGATPNFVYGRRGFEPRSSSLHSNDLSHGTKSPVKAWVTTERI